jgi:hypothetical protein
MAIESRKLQAASRGRAAFQRPLFLEALEPRWATAALLPSHALVNLPAENLNYVAGIALLPDGSLRMTASGYDNAAVVEVARSGEIVSRRDYLADPSGWGAAGPISPDGEWFSGRLYLRDHLLGDVPTWLWDIDDLSVRHSIDAEGELTPANLYPRDISDTGVVVGGSLASAPFRWDAASGFKQLPTLAMVAGGTLANATWGSANMISADGRVILGTSHDATGISRPTIWIDDVPTTLPPDHQYSTLTMSSSGHVLAGARDGTATVWLDGNPIELRGPDGQPLPGTVTQIVTDVGGDSARWIALGTNGSIPGWQGQFVAFADGTAVSLADWLQANYGLTLTPVDHIAAAFSTSDALVLVTMKLYRMDPLDTGIGPHIPQIITAPLAARSWHHDPNPHDVDGNGRITARDALLVINALEAGAVPLAYRWYAEDAVRFLDVDNSGAITPRDALLVLNRINASLSADEQTGTPIETAPELADSIFAASSQDENWLADLALLDGDASLVSRTRRR